MKNFIIELFIETFLIFLRINEIHIIAFFNCLKYSLKHIFFSILFLFSIDYIMGWKRKAKTKNAEKNQDTEKEKIKI